MTSLALFFTYGISLEDWKNNGSLDREIALFRRLLTCYDTIYLITYGNNDRELMSELPSDVVVLPKAYNMPNSLYSFLIPFIYRKYLKRVSVIKTNQMLGSWSAVLAKLLYRKKLYVRSGYTISMHAIKAGTIPRWSYPIFRSIERWAYRHADASSVTSDEQQAYIKSTYHKSDVAVIPNGVDTDLFIPIDKPHHKATELLFVGRLHPEKNILNLASAIKDFANVRLTVIGKGPLEPDLQRLITENNLNIDIIPMVPNHELPRYYQAADIYTQTSLYEGNPKTILEAMSCGLPCLCTNVPGINNLVTHQVDGYLCNTTIESIQASLHHLLESPDLCHRMGEQARKTICTFHSIDRVYKKELELHAALQLNSRTSPLVAYVTGGDGVGWSLDKDQEAVVEILQKAHIPTTRNPFHATHIICTWYDGLFTLKYRWLLLLSRILRKKIVATISNDLSNNPEKVKRNDSRITAYIAPSAKMSSYLRSVTKKNVYVVPFYIDRSVYCSTNLEKNKIAKQLHIDPTLLTGKCVISSFQRDSLGADLEKPKWQKNPDLLIDICSKLPAEDYILLLAGPRRHYVVNKCKEQQIPYIFVGNTSPHDHNVDDIYLNNLPPHTINLLYNITDLYLIASSSEGGPKQAIESCLSKTLVFSTNVGLVPEFINSDLLYHDAEEAANKILKYLKNPTSYTPYIEENYNTATEKMDVDHLAHLYAQIVQETAQL